MASNVLGTKTDITPIITKAHSVDAIVSVDAVHAIVHELIDVTAMACDVLFASAYKIGAARLGIGYIKPSLMSRSRFYKVEPATDVLPNAWEQGTQSFEAQAPIVALLDYWATLSGDAHGDDRVRLAQAYQRVMALGQAFLQAVSERDYITLYGKADTNHRTPTFAFNLFKEGQIIDPKQVSQWLGERNVALPCGNFYALDVVRRLNLVETGFLRVGFLHYSTVDEIHRLFELLDEFVATY